MIVFVLFVVAYCLIARTVAELYKDSFFECKSSNAVRTVPNKSQQNDGDNLLGKKEKLGVRKTRTVISLLQPRMCRRRR